MVQLRGIGPPVESGRPPLALARDPARVHAERRRRRGIRAAMKWSDLGQALGLGEGLTALSMLATGPEGDVGGRVAVVHCV